MVICSHKNTDVAIGSHQNTDVATNNCNGTCVAKCSCSSTVATGYCYNADVASKIYNIMECGH